MKIKVWVKTDKVGSTCTDEFEIEDTGWNDMSEEDKEKEAKEWAFQMMEWGFKEVP